MNADILADAERLFKNHKWHNVIEILEPLTEVYHENKRFQYILGISYLYCGDIGSAYSALRRAQSLDFRDKDVLLALAAVYIKRGNTEKAIQLYIDILDRYPNCKMATRSMERLRSMIKSNKNFSSDPKIIFKFLPIKKRILPRIGTGLLIAFIVFSTVFFFYNKFKKPNTRPDIDVINLTAEDLEQATTGSTQALYILTEHEIKTSFEKAKQLFANYRDDRAILELNKILLSNASPGIKEKCALLKKLAQPPSFLTVKDRFTYKEIIKEPLLYDSVSVIWKGAIANVQTGNGKCFFKLLIGYHDAKILEGIIEVLVPFETLLADGNGVEVLGKIRFSSLSNPSTMFLEAVSLHILP